MESITIKDIAQMCGVGVSTVSRAINNHPDINNETKAMIMQVIKENHYIPNNSARNLKRSDSKTIAVMIKGITNPFFSGMLEIIEQEIKKKKYSFVLQRVDEHEDEIDAAIELAKEKKLRGVIFLGGYFYHTEEKFKEIPVPFVLSTVSVIGNVSKEYYSAVSVDDFKESYKMVDYLCKSGHKEIAIITAPLEDRSIGHARFEGYKMALKDNGIEYDEDLVGVMEDAYTYYSYKNGYEVTKKLLESNKEFSAIFAISDRLAIGACRAITERGKSVPGDYSVAGFDGIDISDFYNPAITTIRQPVEEMAKESIKILFDLIRKKTEQKHKIFPAQLVVKESTKEL